MEGRRTFMKILVVLTFCILMKIASSDDGNWKDKRKKELQDVATELWGEFKIAGSDDNEWKALRDKELQDVATKLWGDFT